MMKPFIAVLRNRHFRALWLAQITSQIALNMLSFVLAIYVYTQTRSNVAVSLMLLSFSVPSVLFGVIAGGIVDFFDKRQVLLYCNIARVVLFLCFFLLSKYIVILFILSIIFSLITQLFIPAEAPTIPLIVDERLLLTANSLFTLTLYVSMVSGFILAGPMMRLFGPRNVYLAMMGIMLAAVYFISKLPRLAPVKKDRKVPVDFTYFRQALGDGLTFILENKRIRESLILMTFAQALIATLSVLAPGFADKILVIDLTDASTLVMGPAALGLVIGAIFIGAYGSKFLKRKIIMTGILATGIILLLLTLIRQASVTVFTLHISPSGIPVTYLTLVIILLFFLGLFNSFISVPTGTILQEDTTTDMRGRIYGVLTALTGGVSLLPVIFSGILADVIGVARTLFIIGAGVAAFGLIEYNRQRQKLMEI